MDIKSVRLTFVRLEHEPDVMRFPDFEHYDFKTKGAGGCMDLTRLFHSRGIAGIEQDRQSAEAGHNLTQEFEAVASENYIRAYRWCRPPRIG